MAARKMRVEVFDDNTARIKLSKQQKLILSILEEYDGEIAEKSGKIKHICKQDTIDHATKTRNAL